MAEDVDKAEAHVPADAAAEELDLEPAELTEVDEAPLTESERVAKAAVAARPVRKQVGDDAGGKGHATPKQRRRSPEDHERRSTPAEFVQESVTELKKVVWPTAATTRQYFVVVLVFVLFIMAFVAGLDALFGWLLLLWLA